MRVTVLASACDCSGERVVMIFKFGAHFKKSNRLVCAQVPTITDVHIYYSVKREASLHAQTIQSPFFVLFITTKQQPQQKNLHCNSFGSGKFRMKINITLVQISRSRESLMESK